MPRLFIAVWPPPDVVEELSALHRKDLRGVRFTPPENWHITLRFLGDAQPNAVIDALNRCRLPTATARLGPGVDMLGDRVTIVPVAGVDDLAHEVTEATRDLGTEAPRKRFVGHLTLARRKRGAHLPRVVGNYISTEFSVNEVSLVESRLRPDGAKYETIAAWPTAPT